MNCYKPEKMDTKKYGKMLKRIQVLEEGRIPAKEARNWLFEGQTKGSQERNSEGRGMSLRRGVSWRRKGNGMLPERKCWKIEVPCPEEKEINRGNTRLCMKKISSWLRDDVEEEKAEMEEKREAGEEESKSWKREV